MDIAMLTECGKTTVFKNVNPKWSVKTSVIRKSENRPSTVRQYKIAMDRKWKEICRNEEELLRIDENFVEFSLRKIFKDKIVQFTNEVPNFTIPLSEADRAFARRNLNLSKELLTLEFGEYAISFRGKTRKSENSLEFSLSRVGEISLVPLTLDAAETCVKQLGAVGVQISS